MVYKQVRSAEEFIAPLFICEGGYWEDHNHHKQIGYAGIAGYRLQFVGVVPSILLQILQDRSRG